MTSNLEAKVVKTVTSSLSKFIDGAKNALDVILLFLPSKLENLRPLLNDIKNLVSDLEKIVDGL